MSRTIDPPLRYVETAVTLAEVPREVSLTISVSNCLYRCSGCHSPYLIGGNGPGHDLVGGNAPLGQ